MRTSSEFTHAHAVLRVDLACEFTTSATHGSIKGTWLSTPCAQVSTPSSASAKSTSASASLSALGVWLGSLPFTRFDSRWELRCCVYETTNLRSVGCSGHFLSRIILCDRDRDRGRCRGRGQRRGRGWGRSERRGLGATGVKPYCPRVGTLAPFETLIMRARWFCTC